MIILGLTGSIGMGKSTTANMFRALDIPVHDADETVHDLYRHELAQALAKAFPGIVVNGQIDRALLSGKVIGDAQAMARLEAIVHPAVRAREEVFLQTEQAKGTPLVVLDIPLLFETGGDRRVDKILVVTADPAIQRERVLRREGMSEEKFDKIRARQMPDEEKRRRADFILDTGKGLVHAQEKVAAIVSALTEKKNC